MIRFGSPLTLGNGGVGYDDKRERYLQVSRTARQDQGGVALIASLFYQRRLDRRIA